MFDQVAMPGWLMVGSAPLLGAIMMFAFIDSLFFVGIFLSGLTTLSASLYAYSTGSVGLVEIAGSAMLGALLGDQIGFALGRLYGSSLVSRCDRLFAKRKRPSNMPIRLHRHVLPNIDFIKLAAKAEAGIERHGAWILIVGRWLPIASLLPFCCGGLKLRYGKFAVVNLLSCWIWASIWTAVVWAISSGFIAARDLL